MKANSNSNMAIGIFVASVVVLLLLVFMLPTRPAPTSSMGSQCSRPLTVSKGIETEEELQDMPVETYDVGIGTDPMNAPSSLLTSPVLPILTSNPTTGGWSPLMTPTGGPTGGPTPSVIACELGHGNSTLLSQEETIYAHESEETSDEDMSDEDETSRENDRRLVQEWERLQRKGLEIENAWPAREYMQKRPLRVAMEAERARVDNVFLTTLGAHRPEDYEAIATYLRDFTWLTPDGHGVRRVELTAVDGLLTLTN